MGKRARVGWLLATAAAVVSNVAPAGATTAPSYIISTVAGTVGTGPALEVSQLTTSGYPVQGEAATAIAGNSLLIGDATYKVIRRLDLTTGLESVAAGINNGVPVADGQPASTGEIRTTAVAQTTDQSIYFLEWEVNRIAKLRRIDPAGIVTTIKTYSAFPYPTPTVYELHADPAGNLLTVHGCAAERVSPSGQTTIVAGIVDACGGSGRPLPPVEGAPAVGTYFGPIAIAPMPGGDLLVSASQLGQVFRIDGAGNLHRYAGNGSSPTCPTPTVGTPALSVCIHNHTLGTDPAGDVFVNNQELTFEPGTIVKIDPAGNVAAVYATGHSTADNVLAVDAAPLLSDVVGPDGTDYAETGYFGTPPDLIRAISPSGIVRTIAGNGRRAASGDGGPATSAQVWPQTLASTGSGLAMSADWDLRVIDRAGVISTIATPGGRDTHYVGSDAAGNVYSMGYKLFKISPSGGLTDLGTGPPANVSAMAVDGAGDVFFGTVEYGSSGHPIGDTYQIWERQAATGRTVLLTPFPLQATINGCALCVLGLSGVPEGLGVATQLAVDKAGISLWLSAGCDVWRVPVALAPVTPVLVAIPVVNLTGKCGSSGDGGLALTAKIGAVSGLAVAPDGALFISDADNHVIHEVAPQGMISTVAGTPGVFRWSGDGGPATRATFMGPAGIALDSAKGLYVADGLRVRLIRGLTS